MLEILPLVLGPVSTNCYLVTDTSSLKTAVIDPAWDGSIIHQEAKKRRWEICQIWYTHAHFDHIGGAGKIVEELDSSPRIALHPGDFALWSNGGGAQIFGYPINQGPKPDVDLSKIHQLEIGMYSFQVLYAPGHTPGHCIFHCPTEKILFSGDLIFHRSVGRTDLPGGNWDLLHQSILNMVYTLPDETRILSGHGEETTVGEEKRQNPFVRS